MELFFLPNKRRGFPLSFIRTPYIYYVIRIYAHTHILAQTKATKTKSMQSIGLPSISIASLSFLQRQLCRLPNACSSSSTTTLSRRPSLALALPAYPLTQQTRTMMMAGHSKWKKIKHGKGNADGKKNNVILLSGKIRNL